MQTLREPYGEIERKINGAADLRSLIEIEEDLKLVLSLVRKKIRNQKQKLKPLPIGKANKNEVSTDEPSSN
jgi:hypothetical protein